MITNNCYTCKYRDDVPGSCHSSCKHPSVEQFVELMKFGTGVENVLKVRGNPHGIRNGWFVWPMDFDPTWLEQCLGWTGETDG